MKYARVALSVVVCVLTIVLFWKHSVLSDEHDRLVDKYAALLAALNEETSSQPISPVTVEYTYSWTANFESPNEFHFTFEDPFDGYDSYFPVSSVTYDDYVAGDSWYDYHYDYYVSATDASIIQHVTPAESVPTKDDEESFAFVQHRLDRNGVPFYPWSDMNGQHQDIYVQVVPGGLSPQLISYPANRVGGSEGPDDPVTPLKGK